MSRSRAVRIEGAGGVEVLKIEEVARPEPGPHQVLVEIAAAGLNRADCLQRRGFYPAPEGTVPDIPGLEYAGTVCALGTGASNWSIGDRVMGICAGGSMATHIAVHQDTALAVPEGMDLSRAAAIPEVFLTAYDALAQGQLAAGNSVLIHAVGSGVGTAAVQLVQRAGAHPIGTSRSESKLARASKQGLPHTIQVFEGKFAKATKAASDGHGADIILDFVGAAYLGENIKALASQGRLVVIGLLGGVRADLNLGLLLAKRAHIIGTVLRSRSLVEKIQLTSAFAQSVLPAFTSKELTPVIDRIMPMEEIAAAHEYMESNQSYGKIVMAW